MRSPATGRRRWLRPLLLIVLFALASVWVLRTSWAGEYACAQARSRLSRLLGASVEIGRCELDPVVVGVSLRNVVVTPLGGGEPLFAADGLDVSFGGFDPLGGSVQLGRVRASRPRVHLDLSHPPPPHPLANNQRHPCPFQILESLGADRLDVRNASLDLRLPEGRRIELNKLEVDWRTRSDGSVEFRTQARGGVVDLGPGSGEFAVARFTASGGLGPLGQKLDLASAELGLEGFNATLSGHVERLCDPTLRLDAQLFIPLRAVAKAVGSTQTARGQVLARVAISGKPAVPSISVELVGTDVVWDIRQLGNFRARLSLAGSEVKLQELAVPTGQGNIRITGHARLQPPFPLELKVEADRAEFASAIEKGGLAGAWVNFATTGRANLRGQLMPFQIRGEADMRGERFVLASQSWRQPLRPDRLILAFPEGHILTGVEFWPDRVEFKNAKISTPEEKSVAQGNVTLYFDPARGLRIHGSMPTVDLSDFKELAGFRMSGRGSFGFTIGGPMTDIQIDAPLSLHDLTFWDYALGVAQGPLHFGRGILKFPSINAQKGRTQYFGALELDFNPKDIHIRAHAQAPAGRAEDLVDLIAPLSETVEVFQDDLVGDAKASIDIDSPATRLTGTLTVDFANLRYYERRVGRGELRFRFLDGDRLRLDRAVFEGPLGTLTAKGDYGFGGQIRYRFRAEPLDLGELVAPARASALGIHGRLTVGGRVEGTTDVPLVSASIVSPRVTFADRDVGETQLEARLTGRDLRVRGMPFRDARVELGIKLKEPYPYDADIELALPEIRPLLPSVAITQGVSGQLSAHVHAHGEVKGSVPMEASADIERLALARGDFQLANARPLVVRYSGGKVSVEPFQLVGPNTELSASGSLGKGKLEGHVRGALDMRLLESLTPTLERTSGRVELNAAVHGEPSAPLLVGSATIQGVGFSVRGQDLRLRDLSGEVAFSDARLLLRDVEGVLNEGRLQLAGDAVLDRFNIKRVGLRARLDGVSLRPLPELPLTTSGELIVAGSPSDVLKLSGELVVDHLRYEQPIVLESFLQRVLASRAGGWGQTPREWLVLDVGVKLADARVDNNLARMRLFGNVRVTGTNLHPGLLGTLETGAGGLAYFRGNRFDVTQGLMEFKERHGLGAVFDLHAQSQVSEYLVRLHAFGRTSDPKLVLTAEPALSEADIVSLLTLGITSRDKASAAGAGAGLAAEAFLSATGLDRQVERFLPKNSVLRDLSFRVATLYNGATGLVEPTPQLESKLLTEQLKIRVAQPVSGRGTRAQAEYQFTDRLSAQAQWDNENADYSFGNLGLDLKLRWDVE